MTARTRTFHPRDLDGFVFREEDETEAREFGYSGSREVVLEGNPQGTVVDASGAPYSFFGYVLDEEGAFVWMQSGPALHRNGLSYIRGMVPVLRDWHERLGRLHTTLRASYTAHARVLGALGFRLTGTFQSPSGTPYYTLEVA